MWPTMDMRAMSTVASAAVMTATVALVVTMDPSEPADDATIETTRARASASINYVGGAPSDADCAGQIWPYIERRCLIEAPPRIAESRPPLQIGTIDARKVTAAAPDIAPIAATDGSAVSTTERSDGNIADNAPVARDTAPVKSVAEDDMRPVPVAVKKERRARRAARPEARAPSDEEILAAIEQDLAQETAEFRAPVPKRGRVVRSNRLESAVGQLKRMF